MAFVIVQTIEKGKSCLWTVPKSWQSDGVLRWPKHKTEKLRRDPTSIPDDTWKSLNCRVKRNSFISFEEAEIELRDMSDVSDTDHEQGGISGGREQNVSFDVDFNNLIISRQARCENDNVIELSTEEQQCYILPPAAATPTAKTQNPQLSEITTKIDNLSNSVDSLVSHQCVLSQNQELIMLKLAELSTQFDEFSRRMADLKPSQLTQEYPNEMISSKKDLDDLELSLKNKEIYEKIINNWLTVCGKGKGRGTNNAYMLMDHIFDRKFLMQCSWAGGSRGDEAKISFKSYVNTVELIFKVVHTSDNTYTKTDCCLFLQSVLRNAKKRSESKRLKASCKKNRPSTKNMGNQVEKSIESPMSVFQPEIESRTNEAERRATQDSSEQEENYLL